MGTMKLLDPKIKHLQELLEFLEEAKNLKSINEFDKPVDLLPWLRSICLEYQDEIMDDPTFIVQVYHGNPPIPGFSYLLLNLANTPQPELCITGTEPDLVYFSIRFSEDYRDGFDLDQENALLKLFTMLMAIMPGDCTDCCNAYHYANLTSAGILIHGDVSMTYHS